MRAGVFLALLIISHSLHIKHHLTVSNYIPPFLPSHERASHKYLLVDTHILLVLSWVTLLYCHICQSKTCSSGPIVWLTVSTYCGSSYVTKGHSAIGLYHLMVKTHVRRAVWTVQRSRHQSTEEYREIFFNCYSTHIHGFHCALQCDHRSLIPPLIRTHACSLHSAKAFV